MALRTSPDRFPCPFLNWSENLFSGFAGCRNYPADSCRIYAVSLAIGGDLSVCERV
jgi:hypothetical protein